MDLKLFIKKISINTCILFTAITVIYSLLVSLLNPAAEQILIDGTRIVLFFFFSLIISFANALLTVKYINGVLRYIIHYLLSATAFYLCILFPSISASTGGSFAVVGLSLFTVIYALVFAVINIVRTSDRRRKEKKEEYTSRYSK